MENGCQAGPLLAVAIVAQVGGGRFVAGVVAVAGVAVAGEL